MTVVAVGADWSKARPTQAMLAKRGIQFACRYLLDDARDQGKALKAPELDDLTAWGIKAVANFEYATRPPLTRAQGAADARIALAELRALGSPRQVVYFSFDYDIPAADFPGCLEYLTGADSVVGPGNAGAYGKYALIEYLAARGITWLWQTYAWSGGRWSSHATIRQVRNGAFAPDFDGDLNHAMTADYGQWTPGDEMALTDKLSPLGPLAALFPKDLNVTPDTQFTVDSALKLAVLYAANSRALAQQDLGEDQRAHADLLAAVAAEVKRDTASSQRDSALSAQIAAVPASDPEKLAELVAAHVGAADAQAFLNALAARLSSPADQPGANTAGQ